MRQFIALIVVGFCLLSDLQAQPGTPLNEGLQVAEMVTESDFRIPSSGVQPILSEELL
jgi:hypothetical protein